MKYAPIKQVTPANSDTARRDRPLIPADTIANRALVVVIAIMTLLACLTAGAAMQIERASASWRADVGGEMTIQIKPSLGQDTDALLSAVAKAAGQVSGVADARALSLDETERILEPWLGHNIDVSKLPVPRLVVVRLQGARIAVLDHLRTAIATVSPAAAVDDHAIWLSRLATVANVVVSVAGAIFLLVIAAMTTAIGFATRGAVAANREIIEVLHFVGASNRFVARQFQRHFMNLGFRGAAIGGGGAFIFFVVVSVFSMWWTRSGEGAEMAALLGGVSLAALDYVLLIVISVSVALLTGYISRWIVYRYLEAMV